MPLSKRNARRTASPTPTDTTSPMSQPCIQNATLTQMAVRTKRKIQWNQILRGADPTTAQWKWLENERNFSVYTKDDASKQFAVLAIGVVKGSVPEIASLLVAQSQDEYVRKMEALYDKGFKYGQYVHDVVPDADGDGDTTPMHLSVRTASFEKLGGWLASNDEWCYLEASSYDCERQVLEKQLTTLRPQDALVADDRTHGSSSKWLSDITAGFRVEPDQYESSHGMPPGMEDTRTTQSTTPDAKPRVATRVHFYADYCAGSTLLRDSLGSRFGRFAVPKLKRGVSSKAVRQRLVHLAKSCDRLSQLVRRRRLGMQIVVDHKRFLQVLTMHCFCCEKRLGVVASVCRVCGQGVCSDCSAKYERETHARQHGASVRLESVRVCDPCLTRIDHADYSSISDAALAGPGVRPNAPGAKPAAVDLKDLLQDALLEAPSPSRKDAVLSVIRYVLDQENETGNDETPPTTPSPAQLDQRTLRKPSILLTPVSAENDYVAALDYLELPTVPHDQVELANESGRPYPIDSRAGDPEAQMAYPMPANEDERLAAIDHTRALGHGTYAELDIICDIAAKELGSFASLVSIITADEQLVVGANMDWLRTLVIKREDAFCAHAIMDAKPLEVPHPEADIRFSKIVPVTSLGAKYYCGFPIVADDAHGSVIGSLCVIDTKANELTESQFAILQKLALTASKVVRLEGARRRARGPSAVPTPATTVEANAEAEAPPVST